MSEFEAASQKPHRARQHGRKQEKKKAKTTQDENLSAKQRNPKAFTAQSAVRMARQYRRAQDVKTKKQHIPYVDRTPLEPPPIVVGIVGPPKVGKSTLMQCLIKNFTKQKLSNVQGPVTIVSGKKRRLTLFECGNDISSMIDIAKVADLVLLLIDASFGFEMEIFEFLNICQVHGFPKIMGVLTHLDHFKNNKQLRNTKKRLKHRFWTDVYPGAKLFYLSGMVYGEYQKTEIHNLGRFISVMKFRQLQWRTTHPYVLADRMEDLTGPEDVRQNPKCDRTVALYGFLRGAHMRANSSVHIPGCGDFVVQDVSMLHDPCPLPDKEKKRALNQKERLIYAPFSGVGGIVYDKDAVYIDLGGSHHHQKEPEQITPGSTHELVSSIIDTKHTIDTKMAASEVSIFRGSVPVTSTQVESSASGPQEEMVTDETTGRTRRRAVFEEEEEGGENSSEEERDDEEDEDGMTQVDPEVSFRTPGDGHASKKRKVTGQEKDGYTFADSDDDLEVDWDILHPPGKTPVPKMTATSKTVKTTEEEDNTDKDDDSEDDDGDEEMDVAMETTKEKNPSTQLGRDSLRTKNAPRETTTEVDVPKTMANLKQDEGSAGIVEQKAKKVDSKAEKSDSEMNSNMSDSSGGEDVDEDAGSELDDDDDDGDSDDEVDEEEDDDEDEEEDSSIEEYGDEEEKDERITPDETSAVLPLETEGALKWKENLSQKATDAFLRRQADTPNLRKLVYGRVAEDQSSDEEDDELGGLFKRTTKKSEGRRGGPNDLDCAKFPITTGEAREFEEIYDLIKDCFVTGDWGTQDAKRQLEEDEALYGDFEDLETGETHTAQTEEKEEEGGEDQKDNQEDQNSGETTSVDKTAQEKLLEKKRKLKELFNAEYDNEEGGESYYDSLKQELEQQAQMNRAEFEDMDAETRAQYEGYRPGMYVRLEVPGMPCEFVTNFDASYPVIVGALMSGEDSVGYVQMRLKKHRWHKRILKTRDPLIFSVGWRRFQSVPLYSIQDHNMRNRLLKYTPEHLHCSTTIWGPITPQGTGILCVQSVGDRSSDFRIATTGVVVELDKSVNIVKKLKLTGYPLKIYKNTAFIKDMFNSILEVAKFEGATVRTVSGIRGTIKKAIKAPEGAFRATFEDKIKLSDIVFVRTWCPVQVPRLYNPLTTLLLAEKDKWSGMKTVGQLKFERSIRNNPSQDSLYKPVERKPQRFRPLRVPVKLQQHLPFKTKPKQNPAKPVKVMDRPVVIMEPHERKVAALMKALRSVHKDKKAQEKQKVKERYQNYRKLLEKETAKREAREKQSKKKVYSMMTQMETKRKKKQGLSHDVPKMGKFE
ncbi:ribosome biogenesis protein BMS1 homolog isoform X1 [Branchiostoma lanceolatum]|uniref:ribosome biogenesis protein BMS1 homolog isoform X1 n=1 Tax=Branchiostoma lanceolatum TaxID=7740 RepID=UPI003454C2FD